MSDEKIPEKATPDLRVRLAKVGQRLDRTKVTATTVLLFLVFIAILSGVAAGISYVGHHVARRSAMTAPRGR